MEINYSYKQMYMFCIKYKLKKVKERKPEKKASYLYLHVFDLNYFCLYDQSLILQMEIIFNSRKREVLTPQRVSS